MPYSRAGPFFVGDVFTTSDEQIFESSQHMQGMSTLEVVRLK